VNFPYGTNHLVSLRCQRTWSVQGSVIQVTVPLPSPNVVRPQFRLPKVACPLAQQVQEALPIPAPKPTFGSAAHITVQITKNAQKSQESGDARSGVLNSTSGWGTDRQSAGAHEGDARGVFPFSRISRVSIQSPFKGGAAIRASSVRTAAAVHWARATTSGWRVCLGTLVSEWRVGATGACALPMPRGPSPAMALPRA